MRTLNIVAVLAGFVLLLSTGISNQSLAGSVRAEPTPLSSVAMDVPLRVPPEEVPDTVNRTGVSETVQDNSAATMPQPEAPVPAYIPKEQAPQAVRKFVVTETITTTFPPIATGDTAVPRAPETVTLSYGFYWYTYGPYNVAVAGYARTQTDYCATRVYAKSHLYRDVEHDDTWEFMDDDTAEQTGTCVMDSGEALTDYWTAPNNTNWKNYTTHYSEWNGSGQGWDRTMYDSFP